VAPEKLDADAALALLLAEPLLIRRPLMQRDDGARLVGFDTAEVERFLGPLVARNRADVGVDVGVGAGAQLGETGPGASSGRPLPTSLEGCAAASPTAGCRTTPA
jgi:hypothetical protein